MNNILKKIMITIIIILTIFIIIVSYYKFTKKNNVNVEPIILDIKNNSKISDIHNNYVDAKEVYSKNFPYNIKFSNEKGSFDGILNLKKGELTLFDNNTKETKKLTEDYIEKVALGNSNSINMLCIYALSKNNDFYRIILQKSNLDDVIVTKFDEKINYMVDLKHYMLDDVRRFNIVVSTVDDEYYLMPYKIPYEINMIIVKDKYALYKNVITNIDGKILKDENGKDIIVKYVINVDKKTNIFSKNPEEIIITTDNRIVYVIENQLIINTKKIKEFKLIKDEELSTFEIIYENETKETFKGYYDKDFNKFDNN